MTKVTNSDKITLKIKPFPNPSGKVVFRVTGRCKGHLVEKNFPTQDEAEVFMDEIITVAMQGESAPTKRTVRTIFANDDDLHAAELAFRRLKAMHPEGSLISAVDFYIQHHPFKVTDVLAKTAVEEFVQRRTDRGNQEITAGVSKSVLMRFIRGKKKDRKDDSVPLVLVSQLRPMVRGFIYDPTVSMRTRRDRYDLLANFSAFLIKERHLAISLTEGIDRPKVTNDGEVTCFTVAECQRLLDAAAVEPCGRERIRGAMLPYFAICMLSGLRPFEVKRMAADWSNFAFEAKTPAIFGFRGKKRTRHVTMHDQLPAILNRCKEAGLAPGFFSRKAFEKIQQAAGVKIAQAENAEGGNGSGSGTKASGWDNDILRHGYASHFHARNPDLDTLTKNMGNSEDVLNSSYLFRNLSPEQGEAYFRMRPTDFSRLGIKAARPQRAHVTLSPLGGGLTQLP